MCNILGLTQNSPNHFSLDCFNGYFTQKIPKYDFTRTSEHSLT